MVVVRLLLVKNHIGCVEEKGLFNKYAKTPFVGEAKRVSEIKIPTGMGNYQVFGMKITVICDQSDTKVSNINCQEVFSLSGTLMLCNMWSLKYAWILVCDCFLTCPFLMRLSPSLHWLIEQGR